MLAESGLQKNNLTGRNYKTDSLRDKGWQFSLHSQGIFQIFLLINYFSLSDQNPLQRQVGASEGFRQHAAFHHELRDHLLCDLEHCVLTLMR